METTLSVGRMYHTLTCGLRQVLGKTTTSLFLLDKGILTVLSVHARTFPACEHGDHSNPKCSSVLPSSPWRLSLLSSYVWTFQPSYGTIYLVCVHSLRFGNWMRLCYDHHDPDVRHWRSYHVTLSGQIPPLMDDYHDLVPHTHQYTGRE